MGCGESRQEESNEFEQLIHKCEKSLGYHKLRSNKIDAVFKRYSLSSKMLPTQFLTACRELKLEIEYGPIDHPVTKFYNSLKQGNFFIQRKLSALGVLLGKGTDKEKAKVLFKIYDDSKDGTLDLGEIRFMLDDIIEIGLVALPNLAMNSTNEDIFKQDLIKFNKKLTNIQHSIKNFFEVVIMRKDHYDEDDGDVGFANNEVHDVVPRRRGKRKETRKTSQYQNFSIDLERFIEKFEKRNMPNLCDAHKLRTLALNFHSQTVAPRELVKDYILESNKK